jgi:hypothetical protein
VGVTSGGGVVYDDGTRMPVWEDRPGQNRNELVANDALRWMSVPREEIQAIRPPVPYALFPPMYGYTGEALTINDIFDAGDHWSPVRRAWISGPPRYLRERDLEQGMFAGTVRYGSSSVNPML